MKKFVEIIQEALEDAFERKGYDRKYGTVTLSNRPDLCQFQCNGAMAAAKQYKKAPKEIADEILFDIKDKEIMFQDISAVMPGFININVKSSILAEYFNSMASDKRLGAEEALDKKTIMIDYGGANVAKPLHVGHLRSAVIGESIKRIKRYMGHNVIGDVHLGDFGMPMGLIIEQLRDDMSELVYFDESFQGEYPTEPPFDIEKLENIYPYASARAKEDEDFKNRAHKATFHLQNKEPSYYALWRHIIDVSIKDLKKNYNRLNAEFDLWKGESDAGPYMNTLVSEFIKKGYAYESQGAIVIDVSEASDLKEIPPCLIKKTDGALTYATSDIATIYERELLYKPDEYIYVVDKRQEMHFTQLFRAVKKTLLVHTDKKLLFLGFGTMCGKDGKPFKTRDGGVFRLDTLISSVENMVYDRIIANGTMGEEEAKAVAGIVGVSALRYGDLSNQISKDYIFDLDRFTSFEGNTGPYILYTVVRIKSILTKYFNHISADIDSSQYRDHKALVELYVEAGRLRGAMLLDTSMKYSDSERELLLVIVRYNEMLYNAADECAPHKICQYIYDLSNGFNKFYHENIIIKEEDVDKQKKWIAMITMVLRILNVCIDLLGFDAPERM